MLPLIRRYAPPSPDRVKAFALPHTLRLSRKLSRLPRKGEVLLYLPEGAKKLPGVPVSPSQALPRQLPQRGSQAIKFITKVLGAMRKLPAVLLALPLGELSPQVTERAQRQKEERLRGRH